MIPCVRDYLQADLSISEIDAISACVQALLRTRGVPLTAHPLGYFHFLLGSEGTVSLRLHYWPERGRPGPTAVTPYHDHVWQLESRVLYGDITNLFVNPEPDPDGPYVIATIGQVDGVDTVVPTAERVTVTTVDTTVHGRGSRYTIAPRRFHATSVDESRAAITIVRADRVLDGGPRTLVPFGYEGQAPERQTITSESAARLWTEVATRLSQ